MNCDDKYLHKVRGLLLTHLIKLSQILLISKAWIFVLLLIVLILTKCPALAAEASEETIATFKAAIEAFKAVKHPDTGKGSALVETYVRNIPSMTGEGVVDFIFKGDLSRSVKSRMEEDNRKQPEMLWTAGEKGSVTYNYTNRLAVVLPKPAPQFNRALGYDFNPDAFMRWYGTPVSEQLERLLNGPATLSTKMDNTGILHLIADYKDPKSAAHSVIFVDPAKGYRLEGGLRISERFDKPSDNHTDFLEVQWGEYESNWYVKSAKFAVYAGIHSPEDRSSLGPNNLRQSTVVTVEEFHPNIEISDSEFTLNGLGLPGGVRVMDRIAGMNYMLDVSETSTDLLTEPLSEAEFPKSVKNNEVNANNGEQDATAIDEKKEPEKEMSISNEKPMQETLVSTHSEPRSHEKILMKGILSIGIIMVIVVIVIGLKLLLVRKAG